MAIKANASSQGAVDFKKYVGVGSFRVLGVNPSKTELEEFYGRTQDNEPEYLKDKQDANDGNKAYKQLRVSFMIQADKKYEDGKEIKENEALAEPLKTTINFFIDSRYFYNKDKSKVQVIDKYGRTAWVTIEQCKNHQIPVYSNGPAKIDADYRPAFRGEAELTEFILNYLNVTPIDSYNSNTGQWMTNPHPEDCEGRLDRIKEYFTGNVSELKEFCTYMPTNRVKLLLGVRTDDQGRQFNTVYSRITLRNGAKSYTRLKDDIDGNQSSQDTVWSNDPIGVISEVQEYKENVKETNLDSGSSDPFAAAAALPESGSDLPFDGPNDSDPFAGM
jgi:hypothetical protein